MIAKELLIREVFGVCGRTRVNFDAEGRDFFDGYVVEKLLFLIKLLMKLVISVGLSWLKF